MLSALTTGELWFTVLEEQISALDPKEDHECLQQMLQSSQGNPHFSTLMKNTTTLLHQTTTGIQWARHPPPPPLLPLSAGSSPIAKVQSNGRWYWQIPGVFYGFDSFPLHDWWSFTIFVCWRFFLLPCQIPWKSPLHTVETSVSNQWMYGEELHLPGSSREAASRQQGWIWFVMSIIPAWQHVNETPRAGVIGTEKSGHVRHVWQVLVAKPKIGHFCHFRADMSWHVAKMDTFSTPHDFTRHNTTYVLITTTLKYTDSILDPQQPSTFPLGLDKLLCKTSGAQ
jgi:hypothetical protein